MLQLLNLILVNIVLSHTVTAEMCKMSGEFLFGVINLFFLRIKLCLLLLLLLIFF